MKAAPIAMSVVQNALNTYRNGDFAQNILRHRLIELFGQFVKTRLHELHANPNVRIGNKIAQAMHDVRAIVRFQYNVEIVPNALGLFIVICSSHLL